MSYTKESSGQGSSRRLAALIYPIPLYLGSIIAIILCLVQSAGMWPVIGAMALLVGGIILQLWLFNLINATNLKELVEAYKKDKTLE